MTKQLNNITDSLARAVMNADADDLGSLAEIHSLLEQMRDEVPQAIDAPCETIEGKITAARRMTEQVILREVEDTAGAVKSICEAVAGIQQLIESAFDGAKPAAADDSPAAVPAVESASVTTSGAQAADSGEAESPTVLKPEDIPLVLEFIAEAGGHLECAEAELLKLEANPEDSEAISAVFRAYHTIKGVAGFLNLRDIGTLAHAAENLLDLSRKGQLQLTAQRLDLILESTDVMKGLIAALNHSAASGAPIGTNLLLHALIQRLHAVAAGETLPETARPAPAAAQEAPTTEIPAKSAEEVPSPAPLPLPTADIVAPDSAKAPAERPLATAAAGAPGASQKAAAGETTVKVATDRLDNLINVIGEMVIAQAMTSEDLARVTTSDQRLLRNMTHLGKITRELQDLSMAMRMVPIQGVFQKMTRLVRDLARKAGKEIELVLTGAETELDRNVVEAISDPLVHMVRNSADHGIEMPETRLAAGKPRVGRIELKAYHQAGNIVIEIVDDGQGLNKERILRKARDAGIIREDQELSEQEIFRLIFHAGLSTAEKITDVSGRGVGMDVVRKNVEALRGRIDIASAQGKGSTFTIRLPLTLAVIDGLIVKIGQEKFIVPITSIERSLRPKPDQISTVQGRGEMCMVRGQLLPLVRLHQLFHIAPQHEDPTDAIVVIVHDNDRHCCLLVDELLGQQQVVIKSLGNIVGQIPGTSGGAIMGDGCVSLILDVPGLIDQVSKQ